MTRAMKDSGIEWIGKIPEAWQITKVKRLFNIGRGRVIATTELQTFGYPVYSSQTKNNGILGYLSTYDFDCSQLTWTTDGANAGTVFLREGKHNCTNVCGTLLPKNNIYNLEYLKYCLEFIAVYHKRADINGFKIMNNEMADIEVLLPSRNEQDIISSFLDAKCQEIDNVITKTRESIEEYKKLKQTVITQAVTKGVRGERKMKDSGIEWIGEIPEEWNVVKITRLLDYTCSYPLGDGDHGLIKTDDYVDEGIPYIRVNNLGWGTELKLDNVVYITEEKNECIKNSILKPGDILFAKTGATIGKTAIVPKELLISNTTSHVGKITLSKKYNSRFFFYQLSSQIGYKQLWDIAIQKTTRPELSIDEIREIRFLVPENIEQQEITSYLDSKCTEIDNLITKKEQLIKELEAYKKSLIYEYVTGKKEVV